MMMFGLVLTLFSALAFGDCYRLPKDRTAKEIDITPLIDQKFIGQFEILEFQAKCEGKGCKPEDSQHDGWIGFQTYVANGEFKLKGHTLRHTLEFSVHVRNKPMGPFDSTGRPTMTDNSSVCIKADSIVSTQARLKLPDDNSAPTYLSNWFDEFVKLGNMMIIRKVEYFPQQQKQLVFLVKGKKLCPTCSLPHER